MGKRRGIDRMPPPGIGGSGDCQTGHGNDETDSDAIAHATSLRRVAQSGWHHCKNDTLHERYQAGPRSHLRVRGRGFRDQCLHVPVVVPREGGGPSTPRLLGSIIGVSGILGRPVKPGDDTGTPPAFFFTSVVLEKMMQSARSLVY